MTTSPPPPTRCTPSSTNPPSDPYPRTRVKQEHDDWLQDREHERRLAAPPHWEKSNHPRPIPGQQPYGYSRTRQRRRHQPMTLTTDLLPGIRPSGEACGEPCGEDPSGQLIARRPYRVLVTRNEKRRADNMPRHPHTKEKDMTATNHRPTPPRHPTRTTSCSPSPRSPTSSASPSPPCATGATSAVGLVASRSAATSATGEPTSSSGSPSRPTVHCTTEQTGPCRSPGAS